ncbi:MAG: hypothetical protein NVSMB53_04140 [Gemmatimonadaceae bacterium]
MMITIGSASLAIQQSNATAKAATTPNPMPQATQDLQAATRELRDAIRNNVQQQLAAASRSQAAAAAQATTPEPPAPAGTPRVITIRGRDGTQTITLPPHPFDNTIPPQAVDISIAFFLTIAAIIIGLPLARAFARRMDRRGSAPQIPNEVSSQLAHLNQAVDAIALEVERISEGQRFTTRLLSEQREAARQALPAGTER